VSHKFAPQSKFKGHEHLSAPTGFRFAKEVATQALTNSFRNIQTQAISVGIHFSVFSALCPKEFGEKFLLVLFADSDARITDCNLDFMIHFSSPHSNDTVRLAKFDCVTDQVN
jgi:hypothetical protein